MLSQSGLSAQDSSKIDQVLSLPDKFLTDVRKKTSAIDDKLNQKAEKYLASFQKKEERIYKKLARKDSSKAAAYLAESKARYAELNNRLSGKSFNTPYNPYLDSLSTSLKFLYSNSSLLKDEELKQLSAATAQMEQLNQSFGKAEEIRKFLKARRSQLKERLANTPLAKELKSINKEVYYYTAQVKEYKELLKDKSKREKKAMELLARSKPFQEFMRKNSMLAGMFRVPSYNTNGNIDVEGLQTRAQINSLVQQRITMGGANAQSQVSERIASAQAELSKLKDKLSILGEGSSDMEMPEGFNPKKQKTKPFLKRLEVGVNVQNQKKNYYFPSVSDISLLVGYKVADNNTIGIGSSFKLGLGEGFRNMELSYEGISIKSFLEIKAKGSFWLIAGYEINYLDRISSLTQLEGINPWLESGLAGISKKYKISKKRQGNIQLLYDFLNRKNSPGVNPIKLRFGYRF